MQRSEIIAPGTVWLVGAGPGDPDLLTRKAERLLAAADIVFHDALVGPGILSLVREDCERVSVGKRSGRHSKSQESINALLVAAARSGKRVVRLKGGDPSIFGRSAEEIDHCRQHGIAVHICPGITAASAGAASGLVSLTLRGQARKLVSVTAHSCGDDAAAEHDWAALMQGGTTLAIYMGRAAAGRIARELLASGCGADMPVMLVANASLPNERIIYGRLDALAFLVRTIGNDDPTVLLIGAAVARPRERSDKKERVQLSLE